LKEQKVKEREEKRSKRAKGTQLTQVEQATQRKIENEDKVKFNEAWSTTSIKVVGKRFHNNFRVGYQVHTLGYIGFGL
jgi:hypothetical protein